MKIGKPTYSFNGKTYDLSMTYGFVTKTLIQFDVDLTKLFEENNMDALLTSMFLNDDLALKLWWHYIKKDYPGDEQQEYDKAIDLLTPQSMTEFKEAWWGAVHAFFDPLRRELLMNLLDHAERLIKKQFLSVIENLDAGSSNSLPKQE